MQRNVTVTLSVQFEIDDLLEYLVDVAGLDEENITQADIVKAAGLWAVGHFNENNVEELFTYAVDGEVVD